MKKIIIILILVFDCLINKGQSISVYPVIINSTGTCSDVSSTVEASIGGAIVNNFSSEYVDQGFMETFNIFTVNALICTDSSYTLPGGQIVNESGNYTNIFQASTGGDSIIITSLTVYPCAPKYCTYTQLFYSNSAVQACGGQNKITLVNNLLSTALVIGMGTRTITLTSGDAQCLFNKMIAVGKAKPLPVGNILCSNITSTSYLDANGKFKNSLLGQTIALGLNLRHDPELDTLKLQEYLTTAKASNCGNGNPLPATETLFHIPAAVISYLGENNTVHDLYELANKALGKVYIYSSGSGNPTLPQISNAVLAVNRAFNKCRILNQEVENTKLASDINIQDNNNFDVIAYPNPFNSNITIQLNSNSNIESIITITDVSGRKIQSLKSSSEFINFGYNYLPGVYFVSIIQNNINKVIKVVKVQN